MTGSRLAIVLAASLAAAPDSLRRKVDAWLAAYALPFARASLAHYRAELRGGRVLELPQSNHYVFLQRRDTVLAAIRAFLLETAPPAPPVVPRPTSARR